MATLGDTSEPTSSAEAFDNAYISFGHVLTMPSGGPWLITSISVWLAGYGETSTCRNVVWSGSTGATLVESATYEATQRSFTPSGSDLYTKSVSHQIAGGSSIIVGVRRDSGEAIFFGKRASGSFRKNEISTMVSNETVNTGAMGAYITYVAANSAPNAPTLNDPTGGEFVADQTPTLNFTPSDPDGDAHTGYTYQVDNNSDFSSPVESTEVNGSFTNGVAINRDVVATLTRGTTYYWRVKTKDATNGYGPYSAAQSFKIGELPTVTLTAPASAQVAELYYTPGSNTTPKIKARWDFSCPDGHAQNQAIIKIYADSAGSPGSLLNTDTYNGSNEEFDTTYAATEGTYYHVSVQVKCTLELQSAESTKHRCRVRWGRATYYFDATTTPLTLNAIVDSTVSGNQALIIEYATHSGGSAVEPSTWYSSVGAAGLNRWFWHRITTFAWGSSPTSPKLNSLQWLYSANAITLDFWTMASGAAVDQGIYVYGSQSLKHSCNGAQQDTYQVFSVTQNTNILAHIKMKTLGDPNAQLLIMDQAGSVVLASVDADPDTDWKRYVTPVINTGSASQLRVVLRTNAAASNAAWFDIGKAEDGTVATPWNPRFLGALRMDAGGIIVDGQLGAIFRMRGSAGGSRDQIELGANGLKFGGITGPVEISSPESGLFASSGASLQIGGDVRLRRSAAQSLIFEDETSGDLTRIDMQAAFFRQGGSSFPASPTSGDIFWRLDRDMWFFYDGTRWLSTQMRMNVGVVFYPGAGTSFSATTGSNHIVLTPPLYGCDDVWLEDLEVVNYVDPAGTNLSASHKWVGLFKKRTQDNTDVTVATVNVDSGSENWSRRTIAIDALLNNGTTHYIFAWDWQKTGTPGNMFYSAHLLYRLVES